MLRFVLVGLLVLCVASAYAQPIACSEDSQCAEDLYCEDHMCRPCINCGDLKRQPPHQPTACVRSIVQCGACFDGLVYDRIGDGGPGCVPPDDLPKSNNSGSSANGEDNGVPIIYVWIVIVSIVVIGLVGAMVYLCRHPDIFKVKSWTNALVQTTTGDTVASVPSEPERFHDPDPPPAYNTVRPDQLHSPQDEVRPFLKPGSETQPRGREPDVHHRAFPYNFANYDSRWHGNENPPSPNAPYENPVPNGVHDYPYPNAAYENPTVNEQIDNMDERTMESQWRPDGDNGHGVPVVEPPAPTEQTDGTASSVGPVQIRPPLPSEPSRKKPRLDNDNNNNSNDAGGSGDSEPSPRPSSGGGASRAPVQLNLYLNNVSVVQNASSNRTNFTHNVS